VVVAQLASVGAHGEPQVNPVWFLWDGDCVAFSMTRDRQKYRNIERSGRAALCISDPNDPFRYLELRGPVSIEDDADRAQLDVIAQKYLQIPAYPWAMPGDERVIGRLRPERTSVGFLPKEYRAGIPAIEI
jgi:PPOX class probable F420-dependent enzyme